MPFLADVRAAIKARLSAITNIGVVNDFEPAVRREEDLRTHFKHTDLDYLLGWSISRESATERHENECQNLSEHIFVLRGYRALDGTDGDTEKSFETLVETVRTTFRPEVRDVLQAAAPTAIAQFVGPPEVRIIEPREFGGVLVHYAEITLRITELVTLTP
jgi:hypothetical protein